MAIESVRTARTSFDLKSASLPVVAVVLKTTDTAVLTAELALRMAEAPGFFHNDPVLIDLTPVREENDSIDFPAIMALLRSHHTVPVAVRGGNAAQMEAALAAGLTAAPEVAPARTDATAPALASAAEVASAEPVAAVELVADELQEP
ncbi:MAG: septum site-determining protein MinC, partial [Giesbergeria sp.]|nr:septum site-determining protein MinC [Giesbergeria sp.]